MSRVCGVCGTPAPPPFRAPAPELAPDLDMRPGEPTRSTLPHWLQTCAGCGAVAPDLARLTPAAAAAAQSDAYRQVSAEPPEAAAFLRWAMLAPDERAEAFLQAAWMGDDAGMNTVELRRKAAAAWPRTQDAQSALRLIDVLRRGGAFADAEARAAALADEALDENSARILQFQRARIASGDEGRHLLSSALRPPARTPHVAHGRHPSRGLWARLLGR